MKQYSNPSAKENMGKKSIETEQIMHKFNSAFIHHNPAVLPALIGKDCVMEDITGPEGAKSVGYDECVTFWQALASDMEKQFTPEAIEVYGEFATIRWHFKWGNGEHDYVRGVNLMKVQNGLIVEALGYAKMNN
ncbi:MAG TPA: nuclear transport factor 2 family protein [Chitinophaga sp.]|uniref:nuclear transport factor 2 family protein n=1 Tax=Chitinophaga sp. TaxID=1869181 RepID=UPI002C392A7F|nr:nuclear transport factor 2 family protein [Chitinophaga sp.]HVI46335.1 nuclear transport factor 2 family protein [Chitinophaga sp.]